MKTVSCGVLIFNQRGELLMAHATGQQHWDIPKGGAERGESPRQAALRELQEETGIVLEGAALEGLEDLGRMPYTSSKSLHLFRTTVHTDACDLAQCRCTSYFEHHRTGAPTPEADDFRWVPVAQVGWLAAASMARLLGKLPGFEALRG